MKAPDEEISNDFFESRKQFARMKQPRADRQSCAAFIAKVNDICDGAFASGKGRVSVFKGGN